MPTARVRDGSPSRCTVNVCWVGEQVVHPRGRSRRRQKGRSPNASPACPPPRVSASLTPHGRCLGML